MTHCKPWSDSVECCWSDSGNSLKVVDRLKRPAEFAIGHYSVSHRRSDAFHLHPFNPRRVVHCNAKLALKNVTALKDQRIWTLVGNVDPFHSQQNQNGRSATTEQLSVASFKLRKTLTQAGLR
jgi:hypothetical protein